MPFAHYESIHLSAVIGGIAGKNRVVITATDNAAQQFETVFPEFLVKAFGLQLYGP